MAMPYDWLTITPNGALPGPSGVGPSSPYFRFLPTATMQGPSSMLPSGAIGGPSSLGLTAGNAATEAGLVRQALGRAGGQVGALNAGPRVFEMPAAAVRGAARSAGPVAESVSAAAPRASMSIGSSGASAGGASNLIGAAESAGSTTSAAGRGLLSRAGSALGLGGEGAGTAGLLRTGMRAAPYAIAGQVGGDMLDESNWLGGSESAANDYASKALKYGGAGAAIGTVIPGIGTAVGGLIGAGVGLAHEGLERSGTLKAPTIQGQVNEIVNNADRAAQQIGLPPQVLAELKKGLNANEQFVDKGDKATRVSLANDYAARVQEQALNYAADPAAFANDTGSNAQEAETRRQLLMQATMVNAIKPYADEMMASSNANAQMLDNLAGQGGELAPLYAQRAASERAAGARYAAGLVQQAQVTPYEQALRDQASYLSQASQNLVSQGMSAALNPQQSAAGSTDLTAIIDGAANQLQPQ